jgi:Right handed beta helix region
MMFRLRFIAIVTLAVFLSAFSLAQTKYAVGTCQPKLTFYTTISQAVSSVPSGATIEVCPGKYPEQVLITQPLTLEGIAVGSSDAAAVTVPSGGLTQNVSDPSVGTVYYQILVQTTGPVNISNLVVDGTNGSGPSGTVAGIFYQDASGTVNDASARNQTNSEQGIGVLVTTTAAAAQTVTVENSVVRGFDNLGISGVSGGGAGTVTANLKANTIDGAGIGGIGIRVSSVTSAIQSNVITGVPVGLYLRLSTASVTANTISTPEAAVQVFGGSNTIKTNRIDAGGNYGLLLNGSATSSVIESNTIVNSGFAVYGCAGGDPPGPAASGFTVTGNSITDAAEGVDLPSGNTFTPNTFHATGSEVGGC